MWLEEEDEYNFFFFNKRQKKDYGLLKNTQKVKSKEEFFSYEMAIKFGSFWKEKDKKQLRYT